MSQEDVDDFFEFIGCELFEPAVQIERKKTPTVDQISLNKNKIKSQRKKLKGSIFLKQLLKNCFLKKLVNGAL